MAKRQTKETYQNVKSDQAASDARYNEAQSGANAAIGNAAAQTAGSRAGLNSAIGGIGNTSGQWNNFVNTGGYSPERTASIESNVKGLQELGRTGGLDAESINRFRGLGGYEEFANTGGYGSKDISNIRSRALAPISSAATAANDELARRKNVQGGYAPGFDSASRAINRDLTRGISDTSRNAELEIKDRVNAGRQWGIGGLTESENALQGLRTSNMFRGLEGAGQMEMQLQNTINQFKAMGMSAQDAAAMAMAQLQSGIFSSDVGQEEAARNRGIGLLQDRTQANLGYYGARNPIATQPGIGGNIISGIGAAAGLGSQFFMPRGSGVTGRSINV